MEDVFVLRKEIERLRLEVERIQQEQPPAAAAQPCPAPPARYEPLKGDVGILRNEDGREQVEVALSEEALSEMIEVMIIEDHHGYLELFSSGRMILVAGGTKAKLLRTSDPHVFYMRILSGPHEGRAGWVRASQYENKGPNDRPFPPVVGEPAPPEAAGAEDSA